MVSARSCDRDLFASCYRRSLEVADELGAATVAFPLVSAGIYGWPKEDAFDVAVSTITTSVSRVTRVHLVAFDDATAQQMRSRLQS
ncbi:macro domain-containing protein [Agrococcus sp. Marseille-Q4369]|uniref:macro domain-containing protein n=1 Tax=Agrococcus sp. Marseille-Q4369 TaxID=2810513 RepID=UPI001B8B7109|nr:macro domain-containing protein [Agrococcus sp. Marseille-Q4369]QUW17819.1 macro domain-containing protein [Agrococcus sp. Marseille-Q4369]